MARIIDDKFVNITNDIEKVQAKPNMYIAYVGQRAFLHLVKESVNNVIDEDQNVNTISDGTCDMFFDQTENMFYIRDHGRGIAFDELENACTILQSGTKMTREHGNTGGENGVGLTATNALSEVFEISSYRMNEMKCIQFHEGKKVSDKTIKLKKEEHGLQVAFRPSKIYLGSDLQLPIEELKDWLQKLSYTVDSERLKFKLTVNYTGKEATSTTVYKKSDFGGFLTKLEPNANLLKTPVVLSSSGKITELDIPMKNDKGEVHLVNLDRTLKVDVVINYNPDSEENIKYSFCNDIETVEHGQHMNAALSAFTNFMRKNVKKSGKDTEVLNNDILFGLNIAVNLKTDYSRGMFTGQVKHKMDNKDLYDPIKDLIANELEEYFKLPENKKTLTRMIAMVNDNIKARLAATKSRKNGSTKRKSFIETQLIDGYIAPNLIDKKTDLPFELYIVEGDSAGGNARTARFDPDIQGALYLTGKPPQIYELDESLIATKAVDLKRLFDDILGCGYGKNFDINKLIYDKIIIGTDADVDGHHIMGVLVANIYKHARPIIEEGHLYRAQAPLYRLAEVDFGKKNAKVDLKNYIYDKDDYFELYEKKVSDWIKIKFHPDDDFISKSNMKRFLKTNRDYFEWLDTMSGQGRVHPDILEYMAEHDDFRETINTAFPELYYNEEENSITGSYKLEFYTILLDDIFLAKLAYLTKIIIEGNDGITHYHCYKKLKTQPEPEYLGYLTIGQIMTICQKYMVDMASRFKGLGEMEAIEMAELIMNPNNRVLIRMTIGDVEETTSIMDDLFMESKRDVRKELVRTADISLDDIDN